MIMPFANRGKGNKKPRMYSQEEYDGAKNSTTMRQARKKMGSHYSMSQKAVGEHMQTYKAPKKVRTQPFKGTPKSGTRAKGTRSKGMKY